jgi:hypothetical protein
MVGMGNLYYWDITGFDWQETRLIERNRQNT